MHLQVHLLFPRKFQNHCTLNNNVCLNCNLFVIIETLNKIHCIEVPMYVYYLFLVTIDLARVHGLLSNLRRHLIFFFLCVCVFICIFHFFCFFFRNFAISQVISNENTTHQKKKPQFWVLHILSRINMCFNNLSFKLFVCTYLATTQNKFKYVFVCLF